MSVRSFQRAHARRQAREQRRATTLRRKGSLVAGLALSSTALFAANAQAADLTVTGSGDTGGSCTANQCTTLRSAIAQANTDGTSNTITFASGVSGSMDISANGTLTITTPNDLAITGPGAGNLTITGAGTVQDFNISHSSGTPAVSITGLTITDGNSSNSGGAVESVNSNLALTNDVISGSTTSSGAGGGGVYSEVSSGNGDGLTLSGTTVSGNQAPSGRGGGVTLSTGTFEFSNDTITNSTISGNTSAGNGAGVNSIDGSSLYITGAKITDNHGTGSNQNGGGLYAHGSYLQMSDSTVSGNTGTGSGGGANVSTKYGTKISGTTFSGNTAVYGGGLLMANFSNKYSPVKVETSTVSGNQATYGAGVYLAGAHSLVTIDHSTLSGNTGGSGSFGGGLEIYGGVYAPVGLIDSTVSGNSADIGAGVSVGVPSSNNHVIGSGGNGSIDFGNSTIAANTAASHAGGIYLAQYKNSSSSSYQSATAGLTSTVVAGNTAQGISDDLERGGSSTTGGFNGAFSLVQSPGNAPFVSKDNVITGIGAQLGPLADNGGPTQTMLPSGTSPVIDQGHAPTSLATDQRGLTRTVDTAITNPAGGDGTDIGAVELPASSVVIPPPPPTPPPAPTPTSGITLSIRGASLSLSSRPLLVGNQTPVTCAVKTGTLNNCVIEVQAGGKVLGSGEAISRTGVKSLTTQVTPTKAGLSYLKHRQLGTDATATLVASQSAAGSPVVTGNVHFLQGPSITLGLGKRSAKLSKSVISQLDRVAKLLAGTKSFTCTAYSDKGKHDVSLTKSHAGNACTRLKKDGLSGKSRVVGRGHANPVASNQNRKGRAANRRLVISFTF